MTSTDNLMSETPPPRPSWLPDLILFNDYGNWQQYVDVLYEHYLNDFVRDQFTVEGKRLIMRRYPQTLGKDKGFWHICGHDDEQTIPSNFSRCERIRWPKAIIVNRGDSTIKIWMDDRYKGGNGTMRVMIWFNDEYVVVLEPRPNYVLFITAYPTEFSHTVNQLSARYLAAKGMEVLF